MSDKRNERSRKRRAAKRALLKKPGMTSSAAPAPARNARGQIAHVRMPPLHIGQEQVRQSPARFKVLACGRRWGKTRLATALCIEVAVKGGFVWWIAPSYKTARPGWRGITRLARQIPGAVIRKSDQMVSFPGGGELWAKSGEDPDALRGEGLDLAALDEYAYMKRRVWEQAVSPALADKKGGAIFISTPAGFNSFYELYGRGQDPLHKDWASWHFATSTNPFIDKAEIEEWAKILPDRIFRQEFLAEFITDAGLVFRRIADAVDLGSDLEALALGVPYPRAGYSYVLGGDWAQKHDFTVFYVAEVETRNIVYMDRFTGVSWDLQRQRLMTAMDKFNVHCALLEENAVGAPNIEALQDEGYPVIGFVTSNPSKDRLIRDLVLEFEKVNLGIPNDPVTIQELQSYQMNRTPSGKWRYSAPEGGHDDCVMGMALTNRAIEEGSFMGDFV